MRKLDFKEAWKADKLEAELEAARDELRGLDKDIRKILGRDLPDGENGPPQQSPRIIQKRPLQQDDRRRPGSVFPNNDHIGNKRRWQGTTASEPKTVFSRLSARVPYNADDSADDDDNVIKPAVSSRIIVTPREVPSRQEVIKRERVDERSRQRNKRMFGALVSTLQKFRQEETKLKAKEDKKAEVEARVEEANKKEKEDLKRKRQQLFLSRKRQIAEVRALEAKVARSRQFQEWQAAHAPLAHFIKTRSHPAIYYLPKRLNDRTTALLAESATELHDKIDRTEKALIEELNIIESQVGFGRHQPNYDNVNNIVVPPVNEESRSIEEGEENRDPNPDNVMDTSTNDISSPVDVIVKEENRTEEIVMTDVKIEGTCEEPKVQMDEKNG